MSAESASPDSTNYADSLRGFIGNPENGILIDAREKTTSNGEMRWAPRAAFRLPAPSNRLQRQYIMIASLFRERKWLDACVDLLATLANRRFERDFNTLASCTATAKHLMEHVHARLAVGTNIKSHYHGLYPLRPGRPRPAYKENDRVLIVTDVVASGTLCQDLAAEVRELGGTVVGVLAIVVTRSGPGSIAMTAIRPRDLSAAIPIVSLCDFDLPELGEDEVDSGEIEEINSDTLLRRLIADRRNGMLLDAREHDRLNTDESNQARKPVFELTSGVYQRHFVTAWGIFNQPWHFEACMDHMAEKARAIRSTPGQWFSTIVTCTATGHHIMEHLQSRIEIADESVKVHYLGPFPFHSLRHRHLDLRDQHVLVVTDVVSQGRLVKNILEVVERRGGTPVAVLSLAGLVRQEHERPRDTITYGESGGTENVSPVPAYYMTSYCIPAITEEIDKIYQIDPNTVLPVEAPRKNGFTPIFDDETTLRHFEDSRALTVGFYGAGHRAVTAAIRLPRLLEHAGDPIWEKIKNHFDSESVAVTTFGKEDSTFHGFVERRAAREGASLESVFLPRSDSIESDFPYFVTRDIRSRLDNRPVVLLLSTLQTSAKLHKLVALLAQSGVTQIRVIGLLNRMGSRTVEFISRIRQMLQGQRVGPFSFTYVYEIRDLHGEALVRTLDTIDWLAQQYISATPEQSYQSLTEQEVSRYLRVTSLSGRTFDEDEPKSLPNDIRALELGGREWHCQTTDGRLYSMYRHIAQKRDSGDLRNYDPVISEIGNQTARPILYNLYAMLLSDVSYLRMAKSFEKLRGALRDSVLRSRRERLELERQFRLGGAEYASKEGQELAKLVESSVQTETYYLFGLALFCYMDDQHDFYREFVPGVATGGMAEPEEWQSYPVNLEEYYGNERILWCVSLLIHYASKRNRDGLLSNLISVGRKYRAAIRSLTLPDFDEERQRSITAKLKYVWDGFLTDIGEHEGRLKHQILRYLQSVLIEPRENHILVVHDPKRAETELKEFIDKAAGPNHQFPEAKLIFFPAAEQGEAGRLRRTLEDAIHASATLEGIAEAVSQLFASHAVGDKDVTYYVAGVKSRAKSFRADAHELRRLLQRIRDRRAVSRKQFSELEGIRRQIEQELTVRNSEILQALKWYIVPFQEKLRSAMEQADRFLTNASVPGVWKFLAATLNLDTIEYVLIEPTMLKDILWNMCTNVRHGLNGRRPEESVRCGIEHPRVRVPGSDTDRIEMVRFWVESPWKELLQIRSHHTIRAQQMAVAQYGGRLTAIEDKGNRLFRVQLDLISRNKTQDAWNRRFPAPDLVPAQ